MRKHRIEDISKRQVFTKPPEDYFDKLPGIIQAQTTHKTRMNAPVFLVRALKLVPAVAVVVLIAIYTGLLNVGPKQSDTPGFEELLSEVTSEDIIRYLEESDISNEEILEEVDLGALSSEFEEIQDPLLDNLGIEDETLMQLFDEYDLQDSLL